ncbi:metallophosphoesterase [Aquiflexum lacus]|uniref:metallophosphoesterase n=1 Tax=Aquiflexum lacus TaxID=2483805 RepID=UPI0018931810|nr:metallophosphoesterase [Aquiflexum lacus]
MQKYFKIFLLLFLSLAYLPSVIAQEIKGPVSEGPYIFWQDGAFNAKWVENGQLKTEEDINVDFPDKELGLGVDTDLFRSNLISRPRTAQKYKGVSNIVVISDIHGQYDLMVELLKNHGVINEKLNWNFGKGHLVINGDIMDRGDKVTEILWLAYKLENQALKAGGKLHFLVGNHELMVTRDDLRYLHEKYVKAAEIMGITVGELYGFNSVLGHWIRQRPAITTINDLLFVHAGISPELIQRKMTAKSVNKMFFENILGPYPPKEKKEDDFWFLMESNGPVWYRGYFNQGEISDPAVDEILAYFKSKHIIVGHTSFETVSSHFGGKVIGVDSSVKNGVDGEVLIVENGTLYRGLKDGERIQF